MTSDESPSPNAQRGFSIVELMVVVAIIGLMAAVGYPRIAQYIRNYKIRTAVRDVVGGLQSARSKAIMSNTNAGVSFVIVDADSYRYFMEDLPAGEQLSPLRDLPENVRFDVQGASPSARFRRLGDYCYPGVGSCAATVSPLCPAADVLRCTVSAGLNFISRDPDTGELTIGLRDLRSGLTARVRLVPGGRIAPDYRQQ